MDLEVVGRHALLFDDDAMAAFVDSAAALVEWNSLSIDRYDVRHLLAAPPPPRKRRRHHSLSDSLPSPHSDEPLESELDLDRYLDFPSPSPSPSPDQDLDNGVELVNAGGYRAVPFSYGNDGEPTDQKNNDAEFSFRPPFSVPESLLQSLPPTEKVHQIIARTAMFVSKHGGQSEIVLRVKQGDNPAFGFLMPDHHLHAYFRFLVDHQELLNGKSLEDGNKADSGPEQMGGVGGGGALSLLGSVYGSGEDEDGATENAPELKINEADEALDAVNTTVSNGSEQTESSVSVTGKDEVLSKHPLPSLKEKAPLIKRNRSISTVKAGNSSGMKKERDILGSLSTFGDKSQVSAFPSTSKVEAPIVEPPSDLKRVVDKIVEFILKNGKEFETVLVDQDSKPRRFPFLLPSNLYHPYYLNVLQKAEESKLPGKSFVTEKHDPMGHGVDKKIALPKESDTLSLGSDIPYDSNRKEKFKMVIGKSKKDGQDPPSKAIQSQFGVNVDAAAAAAILQAATRGTKHPNLEILSRISLNGINRGPSSEGRQVSSNGSLLSSQPQTSIPKLEHNGEPSVSVPVAKAIAKTAAIAAASEADSSEACLTKEQKLKAERLKRAKMFASMIKSGAAPQKTEPLRGVSVEPLDSGVYGSGAETVNLAGMEREGSSVPFDVGTSIKNERSEKKESGDDYNERRSKRRYRCRTKRHEEAEEEEDEEREEEGAEEEMEHRHSRKKRRSHHSSRHSKDKYKHGKRHSSSKGRDSRHRHKHDSSPDNDHQQSQRQHKHDSSPDNDHQQSQRQHKLDSNSDEEHRHKRDRHKHHHSSNDEDQHSRHRHKYNGSSDDEHRHSRHRHRDNSSSDDEHRHQSRTAKHRKRSQSEREVDLEEGEICTKSDQSKASEGNSASREASVELSKSYQDGRAPSQPSGTTEVSDDLRAKIRAMLMATL